MGAPSKRAKKVRVDKEFDLGRLEAQLRMPRDGRNTIDAWSFQEIYSAREEQMLGQFVRPARMAEQMRCDDALFTAYSNRLAPRPCIPVSIQAAPGARGESIAEEATALFGANGVGIHEATLKNIHGCLVDHGVAFAVNVATPREDGSRVDFEMKYWPIEYVRWDPVFRVFKARADPNTVQPGDLPQTDLNPDGFKTPDVDYGFVGGFWIPIVHGDGRWVIFSDYEIEPFRQNAAILPAALVWARHAFAARDWARGSKAHGSAKVIGELPSGVPLQGPGGSLSAEATAFVDLMRAVASDDSPVGIRPAGSKTDYVVNSSTAWQVFSELVSNSEKAAARIYLGTDGTLGAQGGAPGVDIQSLFGVASTKIHGDLNCISRAIDTGVIQPWCAMNFGDSKLAPSRQYIVPNDDAAAVTEGYATRNDAFYKALVDAAQAGLTLTPGYIAELAGDYRVRVPLLAAPPAPAPKAEPAPPKAEPPPVAGSIRLSGEFEEDKHPRAGDGKFGEGQGGGAGAPKKGAATADYHEASKAAEDYFKADPEREARIKDFTEYGHLDMNSYLRDPKGFAATNGNAAALAQADNARQLRDDMHGAPKFEGTVYYRGIRSEGSEAVVKSLVDQAHTGNMRAEAFWFASTDPSLASKVGAGVQIEIHAKSAVAIENVSAIKGLKARGEAIIPHKTGFRVASVVSKDGVTKIVLHETGESHEDTRYSSALLTALNIIMSTKVEA